MFPIGQSLLWAGFVKALRPNLGFWSHLVYFLNWNCFDSSSIDCSGLDAHFFPINFHFWIWGLQIIVTEYLTGESCHLQNLMRILHSAFNRQYVFFVFGLKLKHFEKYTLKYQWLKFRGCKCQIYIFSVLHTRFMDNSNWKHRKSSILPVWWSMGWVGLHSWHLCWTNAMLVFCC